MSTMSRRVKALERRAASVVASRCPGCGHDPAAPVAMRLSFDGDIEAPEGPARCATCGRPSVLRLEFEEAIDGGPSVDR